MFLFDLPTTVARYATPMPQKWFFSPAIILATLVPWEALKINVDFEYTLCFAWFLLKYKLKKFSKVNFHIENTDFI